MDSRYDKETAIRMGSPRERLVGHWAEETRFNLPFADTYDSFLYISKCWQESWFTPKQFHDHFEFCYVAAGSGWFILEGVLFPASAGDIFVTKPGEIHCGGSSEGEPFLLYAIGFRFERLEALEKAYYKLGIRRIVRDGDGRLRAYFERMLEEIEGGQAYADSMVCSCLMALLGETIRLYETLQDRERSADNKLSPFLLDVLDRIHSGEYDASGSTRELARTANLSRVHLDREFKKQMGITLGGYIRGVRLERAKMSLRQSEEPIARIAERLRFDSPQSFSRFFRRFAGLSPQEYRSRLVGRARSAAQTGGPDESDGHNGHDGHVGHDGYDGHNGYAGHDDKKG